MGLPENPLPLILFFLKKNFLCLKRIKGQPSSPDSVAIFEKKLGVFLSQSKKWGFDQNKINLGEKTEVTLV